MIYIAAPLFNPRERAFNAALKRMIRFATYLPQEDGKLITDLLEGGADLPSAIREIHGADLRAMEECKILVAVLDGAHVDSGVAFEIGYFRALNKPVVGLHSDSRTELPFGHNPMISGSLAVLARSEEELLLALERLMTTAGGTTFPSS